MGSRAQSRKDKAKRPDTYNTTGTEGSTDREAWGGLGAGSLLTLSNVISSYSISPSVPFTCNSSTDQKHRNSETDIPAGDAAPTLCWGPGHPPSLCNGPKI